MLEESELLPGEMPDDFVAIVRDALAHLYDYAHLQCHPLTALVAVSASPLKDKAKALRNLFLDTLEQINPGQSVTRSDKEWRPYGILIRRYVNGFAIEEVQKELHISPRQFHREHRKGLLAVASILWPEWQSSSKEGVASESPVAGADLRREVERLGLRTEQVDVGAIVESVLPPIRALARSSQVCLEVNAPRQPPWAWADGTLAKQAVLSALSALLVGQPRHVAITWGVASAQVIVSIAVAPALAAEGSREVAEREERLAAVAELMQAQGGSLRVQRSEQGLGEMHLAFPGASVRRVLVIDDNEQVLRLFERYLVAAGYSVICCGDGEKALQYLEGEQPEAIVLDVMMRDLDGWQLLERLRAMPDLERVPIIVCSVLNEPEIAQILGAQEYVKKPVSQQQLLAALRRALDAYSPAGGRSVGR